MASCLNCTDNRSSVKIERIDSVAINYTAHPSDALKESIAPALPFLKSITGTTDADSALMLYGQTEALQVFLPDVSNRLTSLPLIETKTKALFEGLKKQIPTLPLPTHVYGYVTPYMQSVVLADTVVFIGLNHYLGSDYPGYSTFAEHQRLTKTPEHLVWDLGEALLRSRYPYARRADGTALSYMLYNGAIAFILSNSLPDEPLHGAIASDAKSVELMRRNEKIFYQALALDGSIFSTDPLKAHQLTDPALPFITRQGIQLPSRTGRYLGLCIIKAYIQRHPDTKPERLLEPSFYLNANTLPESDY